MAHDTDARLCSHVPTSSPTRRTRCWRRICAAGRELHLIRGDVLFHEGDLADDLYVVVRGRIAIAIANPIDHRETVVSLMEPGDLFGEMAMLDDGPRSAMARALEPSTVLSVPYEPVLAAFRSDPRMLWGVTRLLAQRLRVMDEALADSVFLDVTGRTAKRLLELSEGADEFILPVTQEELAGHGRRVARAGQQGDRQLHPPRLDRPARPAVHDPQARQPGDPGEVAAMRKMSNTMPKQQDMVISQQLLGTEEVIVIEHTGCGMLTFQDAEVHQELVKRTGSDVDLPFHAFPDLESNLREQVSRIRAHPWIKDVPVHGLVYEVETGRLREVV